MIKRLQASFLIVFALFMLPLKVEALSFSLDPVWTEGGSFRSSVCAWSSRGNLAVGIDDSIKVFSSDGQLLWFSKLPGPPLAAEWGRKDKLAVVCRAGAAKDYFIAIFDNDGVMLSSLNAPVHHSETARVAWSPSGKSFAVNADRLNVYDMISQQEVTANLNYPPFYISWESEILAVSDHHKVSIFDSELNLLGVAPIQSGPNGVSPMVRKLECSRRGSIAVADSFNRLFIFVASGHDIRWIRTIQLDAVVASMAWSPEGDYLAVGDNKNRVTLIPWEGEPQWRYSLEKGSEVRYLSWSRDTQFLAVGGTDVAILSLQGNYVTSVKVGEWITDLHWGPGGYIAWCDALNRVSVYLLNL